MRIRQLHSENIKRVKVIDITPDPNSNIVILSGLNGEGKTSTLDSIWLAFQYRAATKNNPIPVRVGETKGEITVDIGDYIVTRKITSTGVVTLEVRTPDGSKISSPQKLLDGLIDDLSFDPWEFARLKEKEQFQVLADLLFRLTNGTLDLVNLENRSESIRALRTDANREQKRLTTLLTQIVPPNTKESVIETNVEDLINDISAALVVRASVENAREGAKSLLNKIALLEKELEESRLQHAAYLKFIQESPTEKHLQDLQVQLTNIELDNKRIREIQEYNMLHAGLNSVNETIEALNDSLELIEIEKAEALEASPLPVKNLHITPDGLMVKNDLNQLIPFCQASSAQRLRISLGIVMAANPALRVIRIADGSLLDSVSMQIIDEMADEKDFQVWIECVSRDKQDRIGVYIEDGMVG